MERQGKLTEQQLVLIVSLCDMAGKLQGVTAYKDLGLLLAALEAFEPVATETAEPEIE